MRIQAPFQWRFLSFVLQSLSPPQVVLYWQLFVAFWQSSLASVSAACFAASAELASFAVVAFAAAVASVVVASSVVAFAAGSFVDLQCGIASSVVASAELAENIAVC